MRLLEAADVGFRDPRNFARAVGAYRGRPRRVYVEAEFPDHRAGEKGSHPRRRLVLEADVDGGASRFDEQMAIHSPSDIWALLL
jgi:hypothetical protein